MAAKKCTKKRVARAKLLFSLSKPISFVPFSLLSSSSLRKRPILRRRRRRQRKRQNINRIRLAKLHEQHAFLYLSLPSLHDYDVEMPIIMATFKIRNGESGNGNGNGNGNGERGTGNEERGIFKMGNL